VGAAFVGKKGKGEKEIARTGMAFAPGGKKEEKRSSAPATARGKRRESDVLYGRGKKRRKARAHLPPSGGSVGGEREITISNSEEGGEE